MFNRVLIANRGEIAVRVAKTLRDMGIRSIAVYSDADADAQHVRAADEAVRIGPAAALESYLSIERIIDAARETGAQAVHPGYGFLAENAKFARACADAGLTFIGPPVAAIEAMGDKIRAKQAMVAAGVPVVPGRTEHGMSDDDLAAAAEEIGYPVLLKPSAGGGGKGMRLVSEVDGLAGAITSARREARGAFGDDTLLIERFVIRPRHIEIQVLADSHGNVIHLGERECSLQRRHQKIVEEAPSPLLDAATRERMGAAAVEAARAVDYVGAGTVEFIVSADRPDEFFFMEMNTRLQVEHPVTEMITNVDLVEQQVKVAAGETLDAYVRQVRFRGHAIEARVYAEDPAAGFLPTGGTVIGLSQPDDVRIDSALRVGTVVGSDYDPMLAKVITWGADRAEALAKLDAALGRMSVRGVVTNIGFLRALLRDSDVRSGTLDTELVARKLDELLNAPGATQEVSDEVFVAAALDELIGMRPSGEVVDPWALPTGWRIGGAVGTTFPLRCGGRQVTVVVTGTPDAATVRLDDGDPVAVSADRDGTVLSLTHNGKRRRFERSLDPASHTLWLSADELGTWAVEEHSILEIGSSTSDSGGPVTSPMPGTVLAVSAKVGDTVTAGTALLVVEAMKMEHTITAPVDGVLTELNVQAGQQVSLNQPLAVVTPPEER
ncbi:acetyl-CoA/propionyl-CoA carboxylase biotin carboxyl carrier protein [Herbihabitans rhizosphaerae]|uniref:Biotin-dependent 3-methylcrotonyl-coenzyme A carboxylase alpha1 subunit n=1 Tax=Herbihabitans rhizosphaerae TaxID=1872711 RepID=A0A4Q7KFZ5_9PSEU|nr:biotin carboxylase N-terminal domain-containing protein [Herbihabitans rhizosphaerae]RZS32812.1 acetyl-CoA/propionyl-CoA carboxylase biotin carboxyl carrier protein [Herbihabitans rhizosphaerae]